MNKIKRKILNLCLKHLFNTVTEDDVLRPIMKGKKLVGWRAGRNRLSPRSIKGLGAEAKAWGEKNSLFDLLMDDLRCLANERMYNKSTSDEDIVFGKAMLHTIDVLEKKVRNLKKI